MKKLIVLLCLGLGACASPGQIFSLSPVCDAVSAGIGPIKYNSTKVSSRRYAGPDLAPDLRVKNRVGTNLKCSGY